MTPVADCNLAEFYHSVPTSQDKLSLLRSFFGCLATTLTYLHDSQVRHKDIKPQNIPVYKSKVLLTDFGISRDFSDLSTYLEAQQPAIRPEPGGIVRLRLIQRRPGTPRQEHLV
jgi:serine/threonine protein kinase